jgi:hypothetical protein
MFRGGQGDPCSVGSLRKSTQNHWISGLRFLSGILKNWKTIFCKVDLFLCSREGRETHALLGLLERAFIITGVRDFFQLPESKITIKQWHLVDFDGSVKYSELLCLWILSIVWDSK